MGFRGRVQFFGLGGKGFGMIRKWGRNQWSSAWLSARTLGEDFGPEHILAYTILICDIKERLRGGTSFLAIFSGPG